MKHNYRCVQSLSPVVAAFAMSARCGGAGAPADEVQGGLTDRMPRAGTGQTCSFSRTRRPIRATLSEGPTYVLASGAESVSFREHLNNEVRVRRHGGNEDAPSPPAGQSVKESDCRS